MTPAHSADLDRLDQHGTGAQFRQLIVDCLTVTPAQRPSLAAVRQRLDAILADANLVNANLTNSNVG